MNIGEDILTKILLLVPTKTVIRCKSVCKWWYALINELMNNSSFVTKHLSNSNSLHRDLASACVLVKKSVYIDSHSNDIDTLSLLYPCKNNCDDDEHSFFSGIKEFIIPHPIPLKAATSYTRIIGQCNGIVCLALMGKSSHHAFLWNPTLGQDFKLLPPEPLHSDWPTIYKDIRWRNWLGPCNQGFQIEGAMGFGYDLESNDYKVVNIAFSGADIQVLNAPPVLCSNELRVITYPPKVIIYSLRMDSWREVNTNTLENETNYLWPESFQVYSKGTCYWLGREQCKELPGIDEEYLVTKEDEYVFESRHLIIGFDMSSEQFHEIAYPDALTDESGFYSYNQVSLTLWNELIVLLAVRYGRDLEIWLMDDVGGNARSWTKYSITEFHVYPFLMALRGDEILMRGGDGDVDGDGDGDGYLLRYNIRTKKSKRLTTRCNVSCFQALSFVNTIVPVKRERNE